MLIEFRVKISLALMSRDKNDNGIPIMETNHFYLVAWLTMTGVAKDAIFALGLMMTVVTQSAVILFWEMKSWNTSHVQSFYSLTSADGTAGSLLCDTLILRTREIWAVTCHICLGAVDKAVMTGAHVTRGHCVHLTVSQGRGQLWHRGTGVCNIWVTFSGNMP